MADLLPDIPSDAYNSWAADQFGAAVQEKINSFGSDISGAVSSALAPPPPSQPEPPPQTEPPPQPEPAPQTEPEPAPTPPPPPPAPTPTPPPDQTAPPPEDTSPPTAPTDTSSPGPSPGFDPFGAALGAASAAGADMQQFGQLLTSHLQQSGGDLVGAGLGAVSAAGGDVQKFADTLSASLPTPPSPQDITSAAGQATQGVTQSFSAGIQGPTASTPGDLIDQTRLAAQAAGIDPDIFARQINQESGFDPTAGSPAGAQGIAQFMPGTAKGLGIDPLDPSQALPAAAKLMRSYLDQYGGDWASALSAYNAGPGNVPKGGGVPDIAETQTYVKNILGGATNVVQQAANTGVQAVNSLQDAAQSAVARTSQFAMGLSPGDAMAFCGPAAAMAFAETFGRNPTVDEARQLAQQVGWNPGQGMAGPGSEVSLLKSLGIDTHMTSGVDWSQVAKDASAGNPVIIDTPGHYFYVDGYNADTGQFHFGTSATDLRASGGKEWFTPGQLSSLGMGDPRAAIYADHPLSASGSSVAQGSPQSQSILDWLGSDISGAAGAVTSRAQDTLNAVLSTGAQTVQDAQSGASDWLDSQKDKLGSSLSSAATSAASSASPFLEDPLAAIFGTPEQPSGLSQMALRGGPNALLTSGEQAIGQALQGALTPEVRGPALSQLGAEVPSNIPAVGGLLQAAGAVAGMPTLMQQAQTAQDLMTKYGTMAPDATWSPEDTQAWGNALMAVGGMTGGVSPEAGVFGAGGATPRTGATLLQSALDRLGSYPDEIAGPIRQFANTIEAPASQVASTIERWMVDNPLHTVPDAVTATGAELRDAGQQAVADIADSVRTGGRGTSLPGGTMPGQLGMLPETQYQALLPEGAGGAGLPSTAQGAGERQWLQGLQQAINQRDFSGVQDALEQAGLLGTRTSEQPGVIPGFESDFQRALTEGTGGPGVPAGGLTGGDTQWLQDLRQAAAQRDFGGSQSALEDAGLLGEGAAATTRGVTVGGKAGQPTLGEQLQLPGMTAGAPPTPGEWFKLTHTAGAIAGIQTLGKVFQNMWMQPAWNLGSRGLYDMATLNPGAAGGRVIGMSSALDRLGETALNGFRDVYNAPFSVSARSDNPVAQAIARVLETPGASHNAMQDLTQLLIREGENGGLAGQVAAGEGRVGQDYLARVNELMANPPTTWNDWTQGIAQRAALRGDLGGWGQYIGQVIKDVGREPATQAGGPGIQSTALSNTIWPVFRIGWNGLMQRMEKSALGFGGPRGTLWDVLGAPMGLGPYAGTSELPARFSDLPAVLGNRLSAGGDILQTPFNYPRQGTTPLAERFNNNLAGTASDLLTLAISTHLLGHGVAGNVTGAGPTNRDQRNMLESEGAKWDSVWGGDKLGYVPLRLLPAQTGETLSLLGNMMDAINYPATSKEIEDVQAGRSEGVPQWLYQLEGRPNQPAAARDAAVQRFMQHVAGQLTTDAGLRNLVDVGDWVSGRGFAGVPQAALGVASGSIPAPVRNIAEATDPYARQPQTGNLLQSVMQNIPGLREQVPAYTNVLGQPETNPRQGLGVLNPYAPTSVGSQDATLKELSDHGVSVASMPKVASALSGVAQVTMQPQEQQDLEARRGYLIQQNVARMLGSPDYARGDPKIQGDMLRRAVSLAQSQAENELVAYVARTDRGRLEPAGKAPITLPRVTERVPLTTAAEGG